MEQQLPKKWDPIVKLTHWGVVSAVVANAFVTEEGSGWHIWVGYGLAALLLLRWLWGFAGPANARFSAFPPSPSRALHYLAAGRRGEWQAHASHNPLGALMVYAIWSCLAVIIATGIAMAGPPSTVMPDPNRAEVTAPYMTAPEGPDKDSKRRETAGDSHDGDDEEGEGEGEGEEWLEELHEGAVNLLLALIVLHLAGVAFATLRHDGNTIRAMLPFGSGRT